MGQLNPVSPVSGAPLPQRTIATGETLGIDQQNNVAVGAIVDLPVAPAYDDNTIIIVRAAGDASASPITIDGNGQTIDGETSITLNWNRGVIVIGRDAEIGEWCRLVSPRQLDGSLTLVEKLKDVVAGVIDSAASVERIQDPTLIATSANLLWSGAVNGTAGLRWVNHRDLSIVGVDAFIKMSAARNLKVSVWRPDGTVLVTKTFNNVALNAGRVRFMFDAPQAVSAALALVAGNGWSVGLYETSGNEICGWNTILTLASPEIATMRAHILRKDVHAYGNFFQGGDAFPTVQQGSNVLYGICPTFSDDATPAGITVIT